MLQNRTCSCQRQKMGTLKFVVVLFVLLTIGMNQTLANMFLADARDPKVIVKAMEQAEKDIDRSAKAHLKPEYVISGVTVPHHMLAADLIARGIAATKGQNYEQIILLSPDHFELHSTPFGVTTTGLDSIMGSSGSIESISDHLLMDKDLVSDTTIAATEHGIHSVVPFLHAYHPGVPIVAITTGDNAQRDDWEWMINQLENFSSPRTLIVQSTDFSHHLPIHLAAQRDQETIAALTSEDLERVAALVQPRHMDSQGSQYIQLGIQKNHYSAQPTIVANRSSVEYGGNGRDTTTYVVAIWSSSKSLGSALRYHDQQVVYVGGDVFVGRGFTAMIAEEKIRNKLAFIIHEATADGELLINLEGALLPERPAAAETIQHSMNANHTLAFLNKIKVSAASLANNHSYDFGDEGYAISKRQLQREGIKVLEHANSQPFAGLAILPLTFKRGYFNDHSVIRSIQELDFICDLKQTQPLLVFAHWGEEYTNEITPSIEEYLGNLSRCGVSIVVGAHTHQASTKVISKAGGHLQVVFSLGNLIFDQQRPRISGALAEIRLFKQGTISVRLVPIPDLYARAAKANLNLAGD